MLLKLKIIPFKAFCGRIVLISAFLEHNSAFKFILFVIFEHTL